MCKSHPRSPQEPQLHPKEFTTNTKIQKPTMGTHATATFGMFLHFGNPGPHPGPAGPPPGPSRTTPRTLQDQPHDLQHHPQDLHFSLLPPSSLLPTSSLLTLQTFVNHSWPTNLCTKPCDPYGSTRQQEWPSDKSAASAARPSQ